MDIARQRGPVFEADEDLSALVNLFGTQFAETITLDISTFNAEEHYPRGWIPSLTPLGKITASSLYGPYSGGTTDEVQTLTVGGSGLTSFTVTFSGQTTGAIPAAATAAQVQAALEGLSNIAPGDIAVTGSTGGPWTIRFLTDGAFGNTNVAQVTTTPTGGTGTVTAATSTAGGADASADGRETFRGFLWGAVRPHFTAAGAVDGTVRVGAALLTRATVENSRLAIPVDAAGQADMPSIRFI